MKQAYSRRRFVKVSALNTLGIGIALPLTGKTFLVHAPSLALMACQSAIHHLFLFVQPAGGAILRICYGLRKK